MLLSLHRRRVLTSFGGRMARRRKGKDNFLNAGSRESRWRHTLARLAATSLLALMGLDAVNRQFGAPRLTAGGRAQ